MRLAEGGVWEVTRDDQGRVLTLRQDGQEALRQVWRPDGLLAAGYYESFSLFPEYDADGTLMAVVIAAPTSRDAAAKSVERIDLTFEDRPLPAAWIQDAAPTVLRQWLRIDVDQDGDVSRIQSADGVTLRFSSNTAAQGASMTVDGPDDMSIRYGFASDGRLEMTQIAGFYTVRYLMQRNRCLGGFQRQLITPAR